MPEWTPTQLAHFVATADAPGLGQAARKLKLRRPDLVASLGSLEHALGVLLFDRHDHFHLTPIGKEFLPRARHMLQHMNDLQHEVDVLHEGKAGLLRLGSGPLLSEALVAHALAKLTTKNPAVSVEMTVRPPFDLAVLLRERAFELMVTDTTEVDLGDDLTATLMEPRKIVLFCRGGHPLSRKGEVLPKEFARYPLVSGALPPWAVAWLKDLKLSRNPPLTVQSDHFATLKILVAKSDAICGAPFEIIEPEIKSGQLALVRLATPTLFIRPGIIHLKNRTLSPVAKNFITELLALKVR